MLHIVRVLFILVSGFVGFWIGDQYRDPWRGCGIGIGFSLAAVLLELALARRFISMISTIMFGVLIGFLATRLLLSAAYMVPAFEKALNRSDYAFSVESALTLFLSLISVIAILHTKDDFKFVIPFVELKREGEATSRPVLLDTSVIVDGRIADIIDTRIMDTAVIVPRFVLNELQQIADSQDKIKRQRGRRGLDILNRLKNTKGARIQIQDVELPEIQGVDAKLVRLAKSLDARIVTTDFNLNKVAQVQGVEVLNINDLANALRPVVLQGEKLVIKILRMGESPGQGVGYLDDGTMVVAEGCADRIGQQVELSVTNILQTSAGRLVFGRLA